METHYDKCFLNGNLINLKDLDEDIRYADDRLSFTSLNTLNECAYRFFNETWEDIGLSDNDNSAHGTFGHYFMSVFLSKFYLKDFNLDLFTEEALYLAEKVITYDKSRAREKLKPEMTYFTLSTNLLYVTKSFKYEKYLEKITNYLKIINEFLGHIPLSKIANLYVETGIYVVTKAGRVVFGKADLIIEFIDGTYSIIDHKSSFIPMYFNSMQLKMYASILKKPIKDLVIYELSSGSWIKYSESVEVCLNEAKEFINEGLKRFKSGEELSVGEWCNGCPVRCLDSMTDSEGYVSM
jgi:hypothetical protein